LEDGVSAPAKNADAEKRGYETTWLHKNPQKPSRERQGKIMCSKRARKKKKEKYHAPPYRRILRAICKYCRRRQRAERKKEKPFCLSSTTSEVFWDNITLMMTDEQKRELAENMRSRGVRIPQALLFY
jgi:hypothetical protein